MTLFQACIDRVYSSFPGVQTFSKTDSLQAFCSFAIECKDTAGLSDIMQSDCWSRYVLPILQSETSISLTVDWCLQNQDWIRYVVLKYFYAELSKPWHEMHCQRLYSYKQKARAIQKGKVDLKQLIPKPKAPKSQDFCKILLNKLPKVSPAWLPITLKLIYEKKIWKWPLNLIMCHALHQYGMHFGSLNSGQIPSIPHNFIFAFGVWLDRTITIP